MEQNKKTVLLVDDDQFLLNMYTLKFEHSGFEVETATSAAGALQKLRDGLKPTAILIDIVMPGMDGLEFLKRVKEERLGGGASLIVLTNQGQTADLEKAKAFGVVGYIVKASAIPSEVVGEVRKILDQKPK
jgi:CheY-like chemotaxis protein